MPTERAKVSKKNIGFANGIPEIPIVMFPNATEVNESEIMRTVSFEA